MSEHDRFVNSDGTFHFSNPEDAAKEKAFIDLAETEWKCSMHRYGITAPVDFYASRHGRPAAHVELKARSHASDRYDTVFLSLRKWLALQLLSAGTGLPAFYAVAFTDKTGYIEIQSVNASRVEVNGRNAQRTRTDREPLIHVPVASLQWMGDNQ